MGMFINENKTAEKQFRDIDKTLNGLFDRIDSAEEKLETLKLVLGKLSDSLQEMSLSIKTALNQACDVNESIETSCTISASEEKEPIHECAPEEKVGADVKVESEFEIRFLGAPSGSGFEVMNERTEKSISTLYILEIDRANKIAYFYPNKENIAKLVYDRPHNLEPVCDIEGVDDSLCDLYISKDDYGVLHLEAPDYWKVQKKCLIKC